MKTFDGKWALVTGASSGIGAEFASQLGERGTNLVLTARRQDRLEALAKDIREQHAVQTKVVPGDLTDPELPARLVDVLHESEIELDLLVNNAGFGDVGALGETEPERLLAMIRLNVNALTDLTYRVLPDMMQRGHGAIVNLSSLSAFQAVAYMPVYAATKVYVLHFSEALWAEAREGGVDVLAVCPGFTATEFMDQASMHGWYEKQAKTPQHVVRAALKALRKRRAYVVPGWLNYITSLMPRLSTRAISVKMTLRMFRGNRRKPQAETDS